MELYTSFFERTEIIWIGIFLCIVNSALFSGLTIGLFGLSRLRLEVQADMQVKGAIKVLSLRKDANFLLSSLLWGNVATNVLLTLLTESVFTGIGAFAFSSIVITIFGEIAPQAYFTRHALRLGQILVPIVKFYQFILYPVAKPTALLLDAWLGKEVIMYFQERELKMMLLRHVRSNLSDVERLESLGAINFLALDDIQVEQEGEHVDPTSVISLKMVDGNLIFPVFSKNTGDSFLTRVNESNKKWVILTNPEGHPQLVLDSDQFLRDVLFTNKHVNPISYCHRPILVIKPGTKLGEVIGQLNVEAEHYEDDVIDHDLILYWNEQKKIMTGADILGRLLRGVVKTVRKRSNDTISPRINTNI